MPGSFVLHGKKHCRSGYHKVRGSCVENKTKAKPVAVAASAAEVRRHSRLNEQMNEKVRNKVSAAKDFFSLNPLSGGHGLKVVGNTVASAAFFTLKPGRYRISKKKR